MADFKPLGSGNRVLRKLLVVRIGARLVVMHNTGQEIRARPSEFCRRKKIPPPSSLDARAGKRSPSVARNTSGNCKLDGKRKGGRSPKCQGLLSWRVPAKWEEPRARRGVPAKQKTAAPPGAASLSLAVLESEGRKREVPIDNVPARE